MLAEQKSNHNDRSHKPGEKSLGKRSAGNLHAAFDEAEAGNVTTIATQIATAEFAVKLCHATESARQLSTLLYNCIYCFFTQFLIEIPYPPFWTKQESLEAILGNSKIIIIASLSSYIIGEFLNTTVLAKFKIFMEDNNFAMRAIVSTVFGAFIESMMFFMIAFINVMPVSELMSAIPFMAFIKIAYEIILMPFTASFVAYIKKKENIDVYEEPTLYAMFPRLL